MSDDIGYALGMVVGGTGAVVLNLASEPFWPLILVGAAVLVVGYNRLARRLHG